MDRPRRESLQHNGITLRGLSQPTFATKSANSGSDLYGSSVTWCEISRTTEQPASRKRRAPLADTYLPALGIQYHRPDPRNTLDHRHEVESSAKMVSHCLRIAG